MIMVSVRTGCRLTVRQAVAMLVAPAARCRLIARLRRVAMTAGPLPGGLGTGLQQSDVADPVEAVLDAPVTAQGVGQVGGGGLLCGQVGDRIDGLGPPSPGVCSPAAPADLQCQPGFGEGDAGADRGEPDGPLVDTAVAFGLTGP